MNRPLILGSLGSAIAAVALGLTFFGEDSGKTDAVAVLKSQPSVTPGAPVSDSRRDIVVERSAGGPVAGQGISEQSSDPVRPSFDVVRVNPRGDAVIAGRAAPNADVVVRDGEKEVGKAKADARGEWVVVPKEPLPTGSRELTLSSKLQNAEPRTSERNVVIVVPGQAKKSVGPGNARSSGALAVLVPREGRGESIVMQRPGDEAAGKAASSTQAVLKDGRTTPGSVPLSIDAVDYDEAGHVTISGRATPKARLHVYIENKFAGAGAADQLGRWRLVPGGKLSAGLYTLRVDQVDKGGKVVGRVVTQFARSVPANVPPGDAVVFVEPGDSLWRLARRIYGKGIQYTVIYDANREQVRDPDLIYPGQVFFVPHVN